MSKEFKTKDSGKRIDFASGMRRDTQEGKPRYDLVYKPMLRRWAELLARGAEKYGENNWQNANSVEELRRFISSFNRHAEQYLNTLKGEMNEILGYEEFKDVDLEAFEEENIEDHSAAIFFNVSCCEYVKKRIKDERTSKK